MLKFNESLRGLVVGAPVTFLGLTAGEVTSIGLAFDGPTASLRPRVTITFYPERLIAVVGKDDQAEVDQLLKGDEKRRRAFLRRLVDERGLRAQLRSGSLLTGQLYVAFDYFPKAPKAKVNWDRDVLELPVIPSSLADLEAKLTSILDQGRQAAARGRGRRVEEGSREPGRHADGREKADSQRRHRPRADAQDGPRDAPADVLVSMERAVENADATLLGPNAPAQQELRDALAEFTRAARSVRVLIDYLERHPESPIRGKVETLSGGQ